MALITKIDRQVHEKQSLPVAGFEPSTRRSKYGHYVNIEVAKVWQWGDKTHQVGLHDLHRIKLSRSQLFRQLQDPESQDGLPLGRQEFTGGRVLAQPSIERLLLRLEPLLLGFDFERIPPALRKKIL